MLLKQNNQKTVTGILFGSLLTLLASCGNTSAIESLVKADPELIANNVEQESNVSSPDSALDQTNNSSVSKVAPDSEDKELVTRKENRDTSTADRTADKTEEDTENQAFKPESKSTQSTNNLPVSFPTSFPIYPQAQLSKVETEDDSKSGTISWNSSDNRQAIADYYQAQWEINDWDIIKPFTIDPKREIARAIAVKNEQRVALTLRSLSDGTNLSLVYQPLSQEIANSGISEAISTQTEPEPKTAKPTNQIESTSESTTLEQTKPSEVEDEYITSTTSFADLDKAPEQLYQSVETLASLDILTPYTGQKNTDLSKFAPNAIITRGEYARWLIEANNRYYKDDPGKIIYVPNDTEQPAFQDINKADPDFGAIQALAEAGLIPSRLTQDSTKLLFKPDAPLTREDLLAWKVPLDMRQALPKASIEAIKESWGFQDAADIDSSAIRALYGDFQNGDRSNVRRVFGFTTLFQPNKPVTRAEAAASLWYFGFQGDGVTAREVRDTELKTE